MQNEVDHPRLTACGCMDGSIFVFKLSLSEDKGYIVSTQVNIEVDGPVPSLCLFTNDQNDGVDLLVGGAIGFAAVFCRVFNNQTSDLVMLPKSEELDSVTSVLTMSNQNDQFLLVGTYGRKCVSYRRVSQACQEYVILKEMETENHVMSMKSFKSGGDGQVVLLTTRDVQIMPVRTYLA
mmetsp:Transcript_21033/g.35087  ORF Transcript_21033/g.35087 Transcript_21033/m.35087 type:complete len:179 (-) Transcript_21033:452-988(-)